MNVHEKPLKVLVAEDDPDDQLLLNDAFKENRIGNIDFVNDGEELLDYLYGRGKYCNIKAPVPDLILLDLKMPKKGGLEVLEEIKQHPETKGIPVVVLTTSREEEDVKTSYDLGVNSFINKPNSFEALVNIIRDITGYWSKTVRLPFK